LIVGLAAGFEPGLGAGRAHTGGAIDRLTPHDQCRTTSVKKRLS
jgi:hypothetical protein